MGTLIPALTIAYLLVGLGVLRFELSLGPRITTRRRATIYAIGWPVGAVVVLLVFVAMGLDPE